MIYRESETEGYNSGEIGVATRIDSLCNILLGEYKNP